MADLLLVNSRRAMAVVEVEVQTTETINTFLEWPITGLNVEDLPDLKVIINPLNGHAGGDYLIDNFVQNATTGRISFDLTNGTAGGAGDMGDFRIEVERVQI